MTSPIRFRNRNTCAEYIRLSTTILQLPERIMFTLFNETLLCNIFKVLFLFPQLRNLQYKFDLLVKICINKVLLLTKFAAFSYYLRSEHLNFESCNK